MAKENTESTFENIRDRVAQEVNQGFTKVSGTVGRHTTEIMGSALGSLVEDIKSLASGA